MIATYRLQLQPDFGFGEAEKILPYLQRLGVSHLYLSPITEARPSSTHGYDVIDHNSVRAEFGGREGLDRLLDTVAERGMGVVLDWVPNHAGVGPDNEGWQDVLAYGPHSTHAQQFDVDWNPLKPELQGKMLLPFLGRPYGEALDEGELGVTYLDGHFYATYFESRFALNPATYADVLAATRPAHERTDRYWDLKELAEAYRAVTPEAREQAEALRLRLLALGDDGLLDGLELPKDALHALLERQCWRLAYWKTAGHEINYRRFFDVNELVGLRMEEQAVFWESHRLLGELLAHPAVAGVRIDHIDGLFHPHAYLQWLRELGAKRVWVEKILAPGETMPEAWPVEGETGYGFMNDVVHLLVDPAAEPTLDRTYRRAAPEANGWEETVHESKRLVMGTTLTSELFRLATELDRISEGDYHTRDFTLEALREALAEVVAAVDRYRTYLPYDREGARGVLQAAIHRARRHTPAAEHSVYDFVARVALGDVAPALRERQEAWVGRFQQYCAPVAAKGVEDTAFYRYVRLAAHNEVGGDPDTFALEPQAFHAHARYRAYHAPRSLVATATHDHKRGEDTRMRLAAIAVIPEAWEQTVAALDALAEGHRGPQGPRRNDAYLFYQTLAALWVAPPSADADAYRTDLPDRLWAYAQKAAREAKDATGWINPEEAYERDLEAFVRGVTTDERLPGVLDAFAGRLARLGFQNTLTQTILKLTTPGVPDFYQGTEFLDLSLVDPDNRRPVDYGVRARLIDGLDLDASPSAPLDPARPEHWDEAKLQTTARLLHLRFREQALVSGDYRALEVEGDGADAWIAYAREAEGSAVLVLVPRFPHEQESRSEAAVPLPEAWHAWTWTDALTGRSVASTEAVRSDATPLLWKVLVKT